MLEIFKLRAENKRLIEENKILREELEQKRTVIQYLNGCINKANRRYLEQLRQVNLMKSIEELSFPNSEAERQISIHDILEN